MSGRRAIVGLALLCALVVSAVTAPSAMALKGTTAFECKEVATGAEFEDEHCTKKAGGGGKGWKHEKINAGQTLLTANNNITGAKVIRPGMSGTIEKKEFAVEASGFKTCANKAFLENKENGAKQMEVAGETCGEFTGVEVTKPAGCTVKGGVIKLNEKTKGKTVVKEVAEKKQEMFIEFTPPEAKPFATFTFEGATCELKGVTAEVTGTAKANVTTSETLFDGPTLTFTAVNSTLKVGGNAAFFDATFTVRMQPGAEEPPVVLTTTTT
jgi:hypothetical protein